MNLNEMSRELHKEYEALVKKKLAESKYRIGDDFIYNDEPRWVQEIYVSCDGKLYCILGYVINNKKIPNYNPAEPILLDSF